MDKIEFSKIWNILICNYGRKEDTQEKRNLYYSILKDYSYDVILLSIKDIIVKNRYFPNLNEIVAFCSGFHQSNDDFVIWGGNKVPVEKATNEEIESIDELLNEYSE